MLLETWQIIFFFQKAQGKEEAEDRAPCNSTKPLYWLWRNEPHQHFPGTTRINTSQHGWLRGSEAPRCTGQPFINHRTTSFLPKTIPCTERLLHLFFHRDLTEEKYSYTIPLKIMYAYLTRTSNSPRPPLELQASQWGVFPDASVTLTTSSCSELLLRRGQQQPAFDGQKAGKERAEQPNCSGCQLQDDFTRVGGTRDLDSRDCITQNSGFRLLIAPQLSRIKEAI